MLRNTSVREQLSAAEIIHFQNLAGEREIVKAHVALGRLHPGPFFWIQLYWAEELNRGEGFQSFFFTAHFWELIDSCKPHTVLSVPERQMQVKILGASQQRTGYVAPLHSNIHFSRAWLRQRDWSPREVPQHLQSCHIWVFLKSEYFVFMGGIKNSELWLELR